MLIEEVREVGRCLTPVYTHPGLRSTFINRPH